MGGIVETISGTLDSIIAQSDGWMAGRVITPSREVLTVKGTCVAPQIGATYHLEGRWVTHPKFGRQFSFETYAVELPTDEAAIVNYLQGLKCGIGESRAWALINEFGAESAMHALKSDPESVSAKIKGITLEKATEIQKILLDNERLEWVTIQTHALLVGSGLGKATVKKALDKWGHQAFDVINSDPFALTELHGVGFIMADRVRAAIGVSPEATSRIRAGIIHVIRTHCENNGHTFMRHEAFRKAIVEILTIPIQVIEQAIPSIPDVIVDVTEFMGAPAYDIALRSTRMAEQYVASKISALVGYCQPDRQDPIADVDGLAEDQADAIRRIVRSKVFLLTGAPGTGKTHLVKRVIASFSGCRVGLAAPTGKAAQRITEMTGVKGRTVHRLLEATPGGAGKFHFKRDRENQLEYDVVIIDEASMIDVHLMSRLCEAIPLSARLILIGDVHQLPSVGPGNVLRDLIRSGIVETAELTTIKRQDAGDIIHNCHRIKDGLDVVIENKPDGDFFWRHAQSEDQILAVIVDMVANRLPKHSRGYDPIMQIQVLSPLNDKGLLSCENLNKTLQAHLNPNRPVGATGFAVMDKVIQTFNDYENGVFNGEIGVVSSIDKSTDGTEWTMRVRFDGGREVITKPSQAGVKLAYAITIHKSQGSEWPIVVMPVHRSQPPVIMQRNLLYTGISRAQETFVGVGQQQETIKIISRQSNLQRQTKLEALLREAAA